MMPIVSKIQVVSNFSWRYIGKLGAQGISFLVTIILARLIAPESFGAVAIVAIFTSFLQVFVDSGLGSALVQKKNADEIDFSSVFYFNVLVCLVLYAFLFASAPLIAKFYDNPQLSPLLRVASLSLIITGLRSTQQTYVTRNLLFKKHFIATTIASVISAVIAVVMAYMGLEAWAIVGQQLLNTGISSILLWRLVPWRPHRLFSFERLKGLISYGWKILGAHLVDTIYTEIRSLLIGKVYTAKDLAYYNQGKTFPYMIVSGINGALNSVMFPVMSRSQDNSQALKVILRKTIRISLYLVSSVLAYLFCCAESLVDVLLTAKWLPCVVYMQILCFDSLLWPLVSAHFNAYKAIGKSDLYLRIMFITKAVGIVMLLIVVPFGVLWVAITSALAMVFQSVMVSMVSKKINDYNYKEQISDLFNANIPAFLIFVTTWWIQWLPLIPILIFFLQTLLAVIVFFVYGSLSKSEAFEILLSFVKTRKRKNKYLC